MTRIDPSALIKALRPSAAQPEKPTSLQPAVSSSSKPETSRSAQTIAPQQQLLQRVRSIAADDPERRQKAFRFFMEYVLLDKFGKALELDPEFPHLVDQVLTQMNEDPQLLQASQRAAEALLEGLSPPPR